MHNVTKSKCNQRPMHNVTNLSRITFAVLSLLQVERQFSQKLLGLIVPLNIFISQEYQICPDLVPTLTT